MISRLLIATNKGKRLNRSNEVLPPVKTTTRLLDVEIDRLKTRPVPSKYQAKNLLPSNKRINVRKKIA